MLPQIIFDSSKQSLYLFFSPPCSSLMSVANLGARRSECKVLIEALGTPRAPCPVPTCCAAPALLLPPSTKTAPCWGFPQQQHPEHPFPNAPTGLVRCQAALPLLPRRCQHTGQAPPARHGSPHHFPHPACHRRGFPDRSSWEELWVGTWLPSPPGTLLLGRGNHTLGLVWNAPA